ncbi:MAG TPA: DUF3108 domain-containing protein, partial [Gemmatimonadaceae bacterium]|nr:DUF3108 domain-containing protein [Gemmatimonadaceae bacterium]
MTGSAMGAVVRGALVATLAGALGAGAATIAATPARAQASTVAYDLAPVPFAVGEELTYKASFGGIPAGTARMRVAGIELVRGRPAYHVVFSIEGGVPLFRVRDHYESWIDVQTLSSLRHVQRISEGRYKRNTTYEIYPERAQYRKNDDPMERSVKNPLDDGSFIYAIRAAGVRPGQTIRTERYFRPDRNPVVLTGLRTEPVKVEAGSYTATVVRPTIRTSGLFSEGGQAQVWFS